MIFRKLISAIISITVLICISGCNKTPVPEDLIRVGTISGPETELMEVAKEVAFRDYGVTVNIKSFSDYVTPNVALYERNIDANVYQHTPYLEVTNDARGYDLVPVGRTFVYPMGIYSLKLKSLKSLPEKSLIGIPNDPSNHARSLELLQSAGLIKLHSGKKTPNVEDIQENPHHLKFKELDAAQLPRALTDLDAAVINTTYAIPAGMSLDDAIYVEGKDSPYANIIVTVPELESSYKVSALIKALNSDEVAEAAEQLFQGTAVQAW
ncbi:MAG: hypothetical protein CMF48_02920 [Legionellales bacterium]|nr:hypothetical protein [Legionellales bacterium]